MFLGSIDISEVISIWPYIFISFLIVLALYMVKGLKFYYITRVFLGDRLPFWRAILIRVSSEFFSLIGVSYVGDEAYRIYILNKHYGVDLGVASVIGYIEVLAEVIISASIVFLGVIYLVVNQVMNLALYILIISTVIIISFHFILVYRTRLVRKFVVRLVNGLGFLLGRDRALGISRGLEELLSSFEVGLNHIFEKSEVMTVILLSTVVTAFLGGLSLWVLTFPQKVYIDLLGAVVVLHMSLILSSLPITVSGSGLFELVILLFGREFSSEMPWLLPVSFRISSYYLPLIFTLVLLYWLVDRYVY
jgi:uncharacterized protein (TIRG00374 family)